jgi:hypothetical protein
MNLENFKQAYVKTISESTDDSDLTNYIRSIVEEAVTEGKLSSLAKTAVGRLGKMAGIGSKNEPNFGFKPKDKVGTPKEQEQAMEQLDNIRNYFMEIDDLLRILDTKIKNEYIDDFIDEFNELLVDLKSLK